MHTILSAVVDWVWEDFEALLSIWAILVDSLAICLIVGSRGCWIGWEDYSVERKGYWIAASLL